MHKHTQHTRFTKTHPTHSPSRTHTHIQHRLRIKWLRWHSVSVSLSPFLALSLSGFATVATESRMRGGGGGECEGEEKREARKSDGTSKWEIGESETTGRVKRGFALLLQCVCVVVCVRMCVRERECEREKESNYALVVRGRNRKNVFLVRDQEQECTLCSTQVCVVYIWPGLAACPLRCLCNFVSHS